MNSDEAAIFTICCGNDPLALRGPLGIQHNNGDTIQTYDNRPVFPDYSGDLMTMVELVIRTPIIRIIM